MVIDLSKRMSMDEWRFLHTPEMYYKVYAENPDPEQIALAALRKAKREMAAQFSREVAKVEAQKADDYTVNIKSNINIKK